ncbi:hypothetical protein DQK32_25735 [Salmonella enterica subsp. enterica serovar Newport]|uniref:Uncharacterized protein n=1 Tax=Salmonella newport TaxID=108619 RepID=A0A5U9VU15_SALNE|nr:hypothetical protein [Salmonella enterica subsp. enterica serovar Newport]
MYLLNGGLPVADTMTCSGYSISGKTVPVVIQNTKPRTAADCKIWLAQMFLFFRCNSLPISAGVGDREAGGFRTLIRKCYSIVADTNESVPDRIYPNLSAGVSKNYNNKNYRSQKGKFNI